MKTTGIVRELDSFNRIVIPKEIIKTRNLEGASMEILVDGDSIVLRKYNPGCSMCGSMDNIATVDGIIFCIECAKKISEAIHA